MIGQATLTDAIIVLLFLQVLWTTIDRLYLSPLAAIPGPKLAALTWWYECFYDVIRPGRYAFKIKELHGHYGPIIRVNPREVSIVDPEFVDTIYAPGSGSKRDKDTFKARTLGTDTSIGGAVEHDLHRLRREALAPFFAQKRIWDLEPMLSGKFRQLDDIWAKHVNGPELNLSDVYFAVANDIVLQFCFGYDSNLLSDLGKASELRDNLAHMLRGVKFSTHFGWVHNLVAVFPKFLRAHFEPKGVKDMHVLREGIHRDVQRILDSEGKVTNPTRTHSILHGLRNSDTLPPQEKTAQRLEDEATLLVMAGTESTAKSLAIAHFYLIAQPTTTAKLRAELHAHHHAQLPPSKLQDLPYLNAVIWEAHRLSFGLTGRNPRVAPDETLVYTSPTDSAGRCKSFTIPPGTPVCAPTLVLHTNPEIFPNPWAFEPERWLGEDGRKRRRYMLSFIRGPRRCVGLNLANAEMAMMLRSVADWDMVLGSRTTEEDVRFAHDYHVAAPKLDSFGVEARVTGKAAATS